MEMKRINAGKLRAIGYDPRGRTLRVEFDDGSAIDYPGSPMNMALRNIK